MTNVISNLITSRINNKHRKVKKQLKPILTIQLLHKTHSKENNNIRIQILIKIDQTILIKIPKRIIKKQLIKPVKLTKQLMLKPIKIKINRVLQILKKGTCDTVLFRKTNGINFPFVYKTIFHRCFKFK